MKQRFYLFLTALFSVFTTFNVSAQANINQIQDPVKWTSKIEKIADNEYKIYLDATIEENWHMYSQFTPEGGPLPLEFIYENKEGNYEPIGKAEESTYTKHFNDIFEVDEYYFADEAHFSQVIKVTNPDLQKIQLELSYQACVDMCINLNKFFEFDVKNLTSKEVKAFSDASTDIKKNGRR